MLRLKKPLRTACEAAVTAGSQEARVDYLTAAQRAQCEARTRAEFAELNRHLPPPGLPLPTPSGARGRAFLPSIEQVSPALVAAAMARLAFTLDNGEAAQAERRERRAERVAERGGPAKAAGSRPWADPERAARKLARFAANGELPKRRNRPA
jgi:hypothetical protein